MELILQIIAIGVAGYLFATLRAWEWMRYNWWNKKKAKDKYLHPVKPFQCAGCMAFWFGVLWFGVHGNEWEQSIIYSLCSVLIAKIIERHT